MPKATAKSDGSKTTAVKEITKEDTLPAQVETVTSTGTVYIKSPSGRVKENNRIQYIIVNERDTKSGIENEFDLLGWELQRYNELEKDFTLTPGQILYLQPKRDRAEPGKEYHTAKEGETMYQISQIYGIKLKQLYIMNRMDPAGNPSAGQRIWLRNIKPVD